MASRGLRGFLIPPLVGATLLAATQVRASEVFLLALRGEAFDTKSAPFPSGAIYIARPYHGARLAFWPGFRGPDDRGVRWGVAGSSASAAAEPDPAGEPAPGATARIENGLFSLSLLLGAPVLVGTNWGVRVECGLGLVGFGSFGQGYMWPSLPDGGGLGSLGLSAQWRFRRSLGITLRAEALDAWSVGRDSFPYCPGNSLQVGLAFWDEAR
jgi:hypothetical protein